MITGPLSRVMVEFFRVSLVLKRDHRLIVSQIGLFFKSFPGGK